MSENTALPNTGSIWKKLGPVDNDRLFAKIMKSRNIPFLVKRWIHLYILNQDEAIRILLQLFIDLSSYQFIDLENLLRSNDIDDIVPHLESESMNNSVLLETGKYFFFVRKRLFLKKHGKIEEFIIILILKCANRKIINLMLEPVVKFVTDMANSHIRAIRHTGVYIGLKIQTALIDLVSQYSALIYSTSEQLVTTIDQTLGFQIEHKLIKYKENYEQLTVQLNFLNTNIFMKNINFGDSKLYLMRQDCIVELKHWIGIFPDRYLKRNNIDMIAAAITDSNKNVRMRAIDLLIEIIDKHYENISDFAPIYVNTFTSRFVDIDYKVAVHAVEAITTFCKNIPVSASIREDVISYIYSDNFNLAAACGRFFAVQLLKDAEKYNDDIEFGKHILKKIIKFEQNNNTPECCLPYLVEALYDPLPQLQNISLYMEFIKKPNLSDLIAEIILKILTEIVCIGYIGTCTWTRKVSRKTKVTIEQKKLLTSEMLIALPKLLERFELKQLYLLVTIINRYKVYTVPVEYLNMTNETNKSII